MVGEAARHRLRRAHHVAVVAAAQRLGGVERGVVAERHERILQLRPGCARARGRRRWPRTSPPGAGRARRARGCGRDRRGRTAAAAPHRGPPGRTRRAGAGQSAHRASPQAGGAARQADEALGMVDHRPTSTTARPARAEGALAGVRVGEGDDPAEVAPAALVAHEQREVARAAALGACAPRRRAPEPPQRDRSRRRGSPSARSRRRSGPAPSSPRRSCGRSARAPRSRALPRAAPAPRAARRRPGTSTPSGSAAPRMGREGRIVDGQRLGEPAAG